MSLNGDARRRAAAEEEESAREEEEEGRLDAGAGGDAYCRVLGRVQARQPQGRGRKRKGGGSQQHAPGGVALNESTEITDAMSLPKR